VSASPGDLGVVATRDPVPGVVDEVEVDALGEVLPQEAVGVLVRGALPGRVWVGEVDPDAAGVLDPLVVEHLVALVPGQRAPECRWQSGEERDERVTDVAGRVAATDRH